jgi:Ca-activated chloride channel family protein
MSAELDRIKKMQAEGKLTKEQADRLIRALPGEMHNPEMSKNNKSQKGIMRVGAGILIVCALAAMIVLLSQKSHPDRQAVMKESNVSNTEVTANALLHQSLTENGAAEVPADYHVVEVPADYIASQGELLFLKGDKKMSLPLMHTDVAGRIDGYLARVNVTQKFVNLADTTIEALYTFPLPDNSAVDSMVMIIGDRRIRGIIKERGEARAMYEQARREGKTASLLEQERPNIFTQSVANILKGDTLLVTISYVQELKFKNGKYEFSFPMVVGPRYIPGEPVKPAVNGTVDPTSQVYDANRITPPLVPPGLRCGHDISLTLTINAGAEITELSSTSHKTSDQINADKTRTVSILQSDNIPNKDFILEYSIAQKEISTVMLTHRENNDGFFQLIMTPKIENGPKDIFERELVFVVDNSGSMMGEPVEKCKQLIKHCLSKMRSGDLFRVLKFAGSTDEMSPEPLPATSDNITRALSYVDNMSGGGGTEMLSAINTIFDKPQIRQRRRMVFFLTDGYIGNETAILTTIREKLGSSRVFGCGVGSSVNRYLIEGMAYNGRGASMFIRQDGDAEKTVREFYSYIDAPVLTDIEVKFKGVTITETAPRYIPDLFAGQPLVITGKYPSPGTGTLTISGKLPGGRKYSTSLDVVLPGEENGNGVIATLWARKKIAEIELLGSGLMENIAFTPDSVKEHVTRLGLTYRIMTSYTSFVAIDDAIRNKSGQWVTKVQAVDLPEGVSAKSQPANRYMKGVLGITSGQVKGKAVASADLFGEGGFANNIDEVISGVGGVGRRGTAGIGYSSGYGSGFGGSGAGGVDELIGGLIGGDGGGSLDLKKRGSLKITGPEFLKGGAFTGGRSKASVMRVAMQNLASLRYAYNKRLREKPGLKGQISVKFRIDEFGKVISCEVVSSTMGDPELEALIVAKIKLWVFEKIDKPGDVTEIVYPFVFSQ